MRELSDLHRFKIVVRRGKISHEPFEISSCRKEIFLFQNTLFWNSSSMKFLNHSQTWIFLQLSFYFMWSHPKMFNIDFMSEPSRLCRTTNFWRAFNNSKIEIKLIGLSEMKEGIGLKGTLFAELYGTALVRCGTNAPPHPGQLNTSSKILGSSPKLNPQSNKVPNLTPRRKKVTRIEKTKWESNIFKLRSCKIKVKRLSALFKAEIKYFLTIFFFNNFLKTPLPGIIFAYKRVILSKATITIVKNMFVPYKIH